MDKNKHGLLVVVYKRSDEVNELYQLNELIDSFWNTHDKQERATISIKIKCTYIQILRKYKASKEKAVLMKATKMYDKWCAKWRATNEKL